MSESLGAQGGLEGGRGGLDSSCNRDFPDGGFFCPSHWDLGQLFPFPIRPPLPPQFSHPFSGGRKSLLTKFRVVVLERVVEDGEWEGSLTSAGH